MGYFNIHRTKYFYDAVFQSKILYLWLAKKIRSLHEICIDTKFKINK